MLSLYNFNSLQILATLLLNHAYTCQMLHFQPYETRFEARYELFNECVCLATIFMMLCFTWGSLPEDRERETVGIVMICVTCLSFTVSLLLLLAAVKQFICRLAIQCKRRAAARRFQQHLLG